jgi:DNA-binding response OmpR family regulator
MGQRRRVLSIDDSRAVHAFLDRSVVGTDIDLVHAESGILGMEILKREGAGISLILLDWEMPGKSGPEVLAEIRASGSSVPVIMVTSKNDPSEIERMLKLGAIEYIMKPFTPDILLEKVNSILVQL